MLASLRALDKAERKEIGELIEDVRTSFGDPHSHRGIGIRSLGKGLYECRRGLAVRLVFAAYRGLLYFHMMGNHDDVQRFLKAHR